MPRILRFTTVFAAACMVGCQSQPKAARLLTVPLVTELSGQFSGSPLSGPRAPATQVTAANADLQLDIRWVALANVPDISTVAIGSQARMIVAANSDVPLLGSTVLTENVRLAQGDAAKKLASDWADTNSPALHQISVDEWVLPPEVTTTSSTSVQQSDGSTMRITLSVYRDTKSGSGSASPLHYSVSIDSRAISPTTTAPKGETVFFDGTTSDANTIALLFPVSLDGSPAKMFAASIAVSHAVNNPAHAIAVARCESDLRISAQSLATRPTMLPTAISQSAGIDSALIGLTDDNQRRASLVFLGDQTDAQLCQDVSLVADSASLANLAQRISDAMKNKPAPSADSIRWTMDRCAFELLTSLADFPDGSRLPAELAAVLSQFAGEAARHPAALDEIIHGVSGEADLHNRIVAQNLVFLTDPSPAARVRAFDWLNSRQLAPAGFDPLGSPRERREAISKSTSQPS